MNTVAKGNLFEEKAHSIITDALNGGKLGYIPGICRVLRKPKYFGHDRKSEVNFDLSVEVWTDETAERFTHLCLIECKDYGHPVGVKELIKFVGDINSVAGKNVKGVFITSNKLQKAAKAYADFHGLMVVYVDKHDQATMILQSIKRKNTNQQIDAPVREYLETLDQLADINQFYEQNQAKDVRGLDLNHEIYDFLQSLFKNQQQSQPDIHVEGAQRRSAKLIEQFAINIINEFDPGILPTYRALPMDRFVEYFTEKFAVKIVTDKSLPSIKGNKINGYIDLVKKIIYIDSDLVGTLQFNFTVAHEMGHYFLHSKYTANQLNYDNLKDSEYNKVLGKHALVNAKHWIEWQANQFAACFLMPRKTLLAQTLIYQMRNGINGHRGTIYVDYQHCNQQAFDILKSDFTQYFQVSNAALEYRLSDINILKFGPGGNYRRTDPNFERNSYTIGQVIKKIIPS